MATTDDDAADVIRPSFTAERLCSEANQRLAAVALAPTDGRTNPQVTPRNLRYYQTLGLLPPVGRDGGRAVYGSEHLETVVAIKRAQAGGTTLREIPRWRDSPPGLGRAAIAVDGDQALTQALKHVHLDRFETAGSLVRPYQVVAANASKLFPRVLETPAHTLGRVRAEVVAADEPGSPTVEHRWSVELGSGLRLSGPGEVPSPDTLTKVARALGLKTSVGPGN